jgi:hypothetical protein
MSRGPIVPSLDPARIVETARRLSQRVHERFPGRSLDAHVARFADHAERVIATGGKAMAPPAWLQAAGWIGGFGAILLLAVPFWLAKRLEPPERLTDSLQAIDSAITIFAGTVAGYFTMRSITQAYSRKRALKGLQALRSFAHVADMLQTNKSPARLLFPTVATASSPMLEEDPVLVSRYLGYCAEFYALVAKVAVLYGDWVQDATVLSTVDDIEVLCSDFENRVALKILQLDRLVARMPPTAG